MSLNNNFIELQQQRLYNTWHTRRQSKIPYPFLCFLNGKRPLDQCDHLHIRELIFKIKHIPNIDLHVNRILRFFAFDLYFELIFYATSIKMVTLLLLLLLFVITGFLRSVLK